MKRKFILFVFVIIIAISSFSCKKESNKKYTSYEKIEKAPKSLDSIYEGVNSILENVEKLNAIIKEPEEKQGEKTNEKSEENKSKDEDKQKQTKEEKTNKLWKTMNNSIKEIHAHWNSYEIEGTKKAGISSGEEKFEESLNKLTLAVENKDVFNILNNGSQVYLNISPFFDSYKDEIKGDLCKIKYYIYQTYLIGESGDLDRAKEILSEGEVYLTNLRHKIGKDEKKTKAFEKLNFSLQDIKGVLNENNSNLLTIKRDIILDNIKQLKG